MADKVKLPRGTGDRVRSEAPAAARNVGLPPRSDFSCSQTSVATPQSVPLAFLELGTHLSSHPRPLPTAPQALTPGWAVRSSHLSCDRPGAQSRGGSALATDRPARHPLPCPYLPERCGAKPGQREVPNLSPVRRLLPPGPGDGLCSATCSPDRLGLCFPSRQTGLTRAHASWGGSEDRAENLWSTSEQDLWSRTESAPAGLRRPGRPAQTRGGAHRFPLRGRPP